MESLEKMNILLWLYMGLAAGLDKLKSVMLHIQNQP